MRAGPPIDPFGHRADEPLIEAPVPSVALHEPLLKQLAGRPLEQPYGHLSGKMAALIAE